MWTATKRSHRFEGPRHGGDRREGGRLAGRLNFQALKFGEERRVPTRQWMKTGGCHAPIYQVALPLPWGSTASKLCDKSRNLIDYGFSAAEGSIP